MAHTHYGIVRHQNQDGRVEDTFLRPHCHRLEVQVNNHRYQAGYKNKNSHIELLPEALCLNLYICCNAPLTPLCREESVNYVRSRSSYVAMFTSLYQPLYSHSNNRLVRHTAKTSQTTRNLPPHTPPVPYAAHNVPLSTLSKHKQWPSLQSMNTSTIQSQHHVLI